MVGTIDEIQELIQENTIYIPRVIPIVLKEQVYPRIDSPPIAKVDLCFHSRSPHFSYKDQNQLVKTASKLAPIVRR